MRARRNGPPTARCTGATRPRARIRGCAPGHADPAGRGPCIGMRPVQAHAQASGAIGEQVGEADGRVAGLRGVEHGGGLGTECAQPARRHRAGCVPERERLELHAQPRRRIVACIGGIGAGPQHGDHARQQVPAVAAGLVAARGWPRPLQMQGMAGRESGHGAVAAQARQATACLAQAHAHEIALVRGAGRAGAPRIDVAAGKAHPVEASPPADARLRTEGIDVAQLGVEHRIAGTRGGVGFKADVLGLRDACGQRQQQVLSCMRGLEPQRGGHWSHARQLEGQPVRPYASGVQQLQPAALQGRGVDAQRREAPEQAAQRLAAHVGLALQIALLLLEQLRPQKQAFAPADLVEPRHDSFFRGFSCRSRCAARARATGCGLAAPGPEAVRHTSARQRAGVRGWHASWLAQDRDTRR